MVKAVDKMTSEGEDVDSVDQGTVEQNEEQNELISSVQPDATRNLIVFSFFMFTIPLAVMYVTYRYLFIDYLHLTRDRAALYAGIVGIGVAYAIVIIFIWMAYREESMLCAMTKKREKSD